MSASQINMDFDDDDDDYDTDTVDHVMVQTTSRHIRLKRTLYSSPAQYFRGVSLVFVFILQVPCCSGLCYDKLAGGAAGVMLTSLLILILWYMAMAMCATMVLDGADGPKVASFPMLMCITVVVWICLRLCFGPGEDQFRAIAVILIGSWIFYVGRSYMGGTDISPMGCEFEIPSNDPEDDPNLATEDGA